MVLLPYAGMLGRSTRPLGEDCEVFNSVYQDEVKHRYMKDKSVILLWGGRKPTRLRIRTSELYVPLQDLINRLKIKIGHEFCFLCKSKIVLKTRGKVPS